MGNQFFVLSIITLLPFLMSGQEFEATQYIASIQGDEGNKIELNCDAGSTSLNIFDYNGHPFIQMYHLNRTPVLELYKDGADWKTEISNEFIGIKGGPGFDTYYSMSPYSGFVAYDGNQNISVQIRGDVGGDGRVTTDELEITGGSDLSENFNVSNLTYTILPGMLVSISANEGELEVTKTAKDKKVVGIISGANGIETGMIMGQKGTIADGDYPIALTGRTYVLANTENGSIEPGDFITSSSQPGYGMKVNKVRRAQGSIIGKAMTSLIDGPGYVLVLVNLQ